MKGGLLVPETIHSESGVITTRERRANFERHSQLGHIPPLQNRLSY